MNKLLIRQHQVYQGHNAAVYDLLPGSTPGTFISAAGDGWVVEWSLAQPDQGRLLARVDGQLFSAVLVSEYQAIVLGDMNGGMHWVYPGTDLPTKDIAHHQKGVYALHYSAPYLYSGGGDGLLTRWDAAAARSVESLRVSHAAIRCIIALPELGCLALGCSDHSIVLVNITSFVEVARISNAHEGSVFTLAWNAAEKMLYSGGRDAQLRVWNFKDEGRPKAVQTVAAHLFTVNHLIWNPTRTVLLSASRDKTIRVWDAETLQLLKSLDVFKNKGHVNSVNRLLWLPDTNYFVSTGDDRRLIIWEVD